MKIIDKTPMYDEKGQISPIERAKAMLKFGKKWVDDIEAQKAVLPEFEKSLDKSYTLLRNVNLPDLGISIPFILVGPPGVLVIYVSAIKGMFRAKSDQWGTISGNIFKPQKPNLMVRTEQMGRALQVYLQRHGYSEISSVESILLCVDPAVHVDSQRPIIRIVMRDALERFIISIPQQRPVFSRETAQSVIDLILHPPAPQPEPAAEPPAAEAAPAPMTASMSAVTVPSRSESPTLPPAVLPPPTQPRRRKALSSKHWVFLAIMFIVWCLIMALFLYFVAQDMLL